METKKPGASIIERACLGMSVLGALKLTDLFSGLGFSIGGMHIPVDQGFVPLILAAIAAASPDLLAMLQNTLAGRPPSLRSLLMEAVAILRNLADAMESPGAAQPRSTQEGAAAADSAPKPAPAVQPAAPATAQPATAQPATAQPAAQPKPAASTAAA